MGKDNMNSEFDFESPEFSANFYKNIEKALGDSDTSVEETAGVIATDTYEEAAISAEVPMTFEFKKDLVAAENNSQINPELETVAESLAAQSRMQTIDVTGVGEETASAVSQELSEENIEDELFSINSSLAQQICLEMDNIGAEATVQRKKWLFKIQSGVALAILCFIGIGFFLGFTKPGNNLLMGMGINLGGTIWSAWTGNFSDYSDVTQDIDYVEEEDTEALGEEIDPSTIVWPNLTGEGRQEEGVYNILLLGEEAIGSGDSRGRTDVLVIATLNTNKKKVLLTSVMRDTLVQIPGFKENKLNVAYEEGGIDLLYETIALNFDIHLDGCVMANFENFEKIVDRLGGLEITLTAGEAKYLNNTNYISNKEYRTVVEGTQLLNGNQVLGYSRVRKRANINGTNNDYGRTERHRIILNAIFDKYKTTGKAELLSMMFEFLPMITTDIDNKNFEALLNAFVDMRTTDIEQLRIPADGAFQDNVKVRGMSVLIPDLSENITILHNFIFGDDTVQSSGQTTDAITDTAIADGTKISDNTDADGSGN